METWNGTGSGSSLYVQRYLDCHGITSAECESQFRICFLFVSVDHFKMQH